MFGYVVPNQAALSDEAQKRYRTAYCGLCRRIDALHGLRGRFTLSYDLTFLDLLLCSLIYLAGFSLNNLSIMAVIVAIGLVVDDAIVVLENIERHIEQGEPPVQAALKGIQEVGMTLIAMNLALAVIFISVLFMGGVIERLFREFSLTLVFIVILSVFISLVLTPSLSARRCQPPSTRQRRTPEQALSNP